MEYIYYFLKDKNILIIGGENRTEFGNINNFRDDFIFQFLLIQKNKIDILNWININLNI